jgi:hypothetical protein
VITLQSILYGGHALGIELSVQIGTQHFIGHGDFAASHRALLLLKTVRVALEFHRNKEQNKNVISSEFVVDMANTGVTIMRMFTLLSACAAVSLTAAPLAFAQQTTSTNAATSTKTMEKQCEDLWKQFGAADVTHVTASKLADAKKQAAHGSDLCRMEPSEGIKELNMALRDIGAKVKR